MNIFVLDRDIKKSVQYHVDKHVVKMIVEAAQLACSAHWMNDSEAPYRLTHKNHPCAIWTRESRVNYLYTCDYGLELCKEYTHRYGKTHKTEPILKWLKNNVPNIERDNVTEFALALPEEYKTKDAIESYRKYYIQDKSHLFSWKNRDIPDWIEVA